MADRKPLPTWFFVMVIVQNDDTFLLVHERKHGQRWYIPAGRVEEGETREESGLEVILQGVLRVEHSVLPDGAVRCRVFFFARPRDDTPPKQAPDHDSLEARWVRPDALSQYPLRDDEVRAAFDYVGNGGRVSPLDTVTFEGAPWVVK